jgi:hypothetical protein
MAARTWQVLPAANEEVPDGVGEREAPFEGEKDDAERRGG